MSVKGGSSREHSYLTIQNVPNTNRSKIEKSIHNILFPTRVSIPTISNSHRQIVLQNKDFVQLDPISTAYSHETTLYCVLEGEIEHHVVERTVYWVHTQCWGGGVR